MTIFGSGCGEMEKKLLTNKTNGRRGRVLQGVNYFREYLKSSFVVV